MVYTIIVWALLGISIAWVVYESMKIRQVAKHETRRKIRADLLIRMHARVFIGLILIWWLVNLLVQAAIIDLSVSFNQMLSVILMVVLVPIIIYVICYLKSRFVKMTLKEYSKISINIGWFLNILTAFIFASFINYSIQMLSIVI